MTPKQENYRHLGQTMIRKFAARNMEAFYTDTKEEALKKLERELTARETYSEALVGLTSRLAGVWLRANIVLDEETTQANRAKAGKQFVDVGICEEHAVAFVSALAKGGAKPVFSVVSTFVQRAYDQLSQDLCINDSPATILVTTGGLATMNDVTHLCWFDIPLLANVPNLVYLCPTSEKEYFAMLDWSIGHAGHPVAIREPSNGVRENDVAVLSDYSGPVRFDVTRRGKAVAILGLGNFYALGAELADALAAKGIAATLVNPRCASALDVETLDALAADHRLVVTLEDGVIDGGFGEKVARHYGPTDVKVLVRGAAKQFADRYDVADFLKANRLTVPQLVADCEDVLRGAGRTETGACA